MEKTEETRSVEGTIEIGASPERVWRALTDPRELERWFPLEARVEPGPGGSVWLSWKNEFAGASEITAWEPPRLLSYVWGGPEDAPPQMTEFTLEGRGGSTRLRVVTSGFPADASWDDWVEGTRLGWSFELRSLKTYLEDHDGEERHVVYLRRRVPLAREETNERLFGDDGLIRHAPAGRPFDADSAIQFACEMTGPGGLFRLSNEPSPGGRHVATLFASAWGPVGEEMDRLADEWRGRLEAALPEGETLPD